MRGEVRLCTVAWHRNLAKYIPPNTDWDFLQRFVTIGWDTLRCLDSPKMSLFGTVLVLEHGMAQRKVGGRRESKSGSPAKRLLAQLPRCWEKNHSHFCSGGRPCHLIIIQPHLLKPDRQSILSPQRTEEALDSSENQ